MGIANVIICRPAGGLNLIGMSDVNSDSSDTDSASVAMSPTARLLGHKLIHVNLCFQLYFPSH